MVKIATWNINGISSRLEHVLKWSQVARPDVLCLQETKIVDVRFPAARFHLAGYEHVEVFGERSYNGVAILSRLPLTSVQKGFPRDAADAPRRLIAATAGGLRIYNVYVPHGTKLGSEKFAFKLAWLARLRKHFDKHYSTSDLVMLCGDLNVAPHESDVWDPRFWQHRMHFTKQEREAIQNLKKWGFVDVFRQMNDEPGEYTWWDNFRESSFIKNRGLRIDHIWASPALAERCADCWIDRTPRGWPKPSDHAPVIAEFSL
ncbi:MAG: exodeoxyribonuclease III [Chloracidobacterium sp.]|nr:exodeoxyribonuclease III [Chloracidobacterium sp.]